MSPVILYDTACFSGYPVLILFLISLTYHYLLNDLVLWFIMILGISIAYYLQYINSRYDKLITWSHNMRDDSTELNMLLAERNKSLLKKQDYEIYNATLKERNRIAREIHDNVGHMLSRSILLTGALKAINKDDNCSEPLNNLHDSLNQAMTSIRNSVHNLHDDSINLKETVEALVKDFAFCEIELTYDMGTDLPREIKYSFISIIKEGLNNIYKHSDSTYVSVTLREHPAMYQLIIADNGTTAKNKDFTEYIKNISKSDSGIGLTNIASRVNMLHGSLQIHTNKGFCIFVTIPKQLPHSAL